MNIRSPAVAGMFYPQNPLQLSADVKRFIDDATARFIDQKPVALIVPHAGYIYSGPIAASGYKQLIPYAENISRVILLGPSHRVPVAGIASSSADYFETPLGRIPLDRKAIAKLNQLTYVNPLDAAHLQEHSLEVQLPFLQQVLKEFSLTPLVVGQISAREVSEVIETFWNEPEVLFLISSDLSHYLDYNTARHCDHATCKAIEELHPEKIKYQNACGRLPVSGMLLSARKHHLKVQTLDLRNSGDTAGSKDRVVGYGCWAFYPE